MSVLCLKNVSKSFVSGQDSVTVLNNVNFELNEGECVALIAPSGSGKSTLLQISATLDKPTSGSVRICNKNISAMSDDEKSSMRAKYLGFVYQFHNLLPDFTALENVIMPLLICGTPKNKAKEEATELLIQMGLGHRINNKPTQLSGGEQQRISIARALINKPKIIFADEPTGNLDPTTASKVFYLLMQYVSYYKCAIMMATHNMELAYKLNRQVTLANGNLLEVHK